jgi:formamidopyrimidine-DNA glycosylase
MTGKFIIQDKIIETEKHSMIIFSTDTENIIFSDIRKFATINLINTLKLYENSYLKNIGIDPTLDNFTYDIFKEIINSSHKKTTKAFLLEQTKIVGIGNIYASEILFNAKISPERIIGSLTNIEINTLHGSIVSILKEAISLRGTTFSDYRDGFNKKGGFQNKLKVYNKYNETCSSCGEKIKKIKQNGRSTFYCNTCQK